MDLITYKLLNRQHFNDSVHKHAINSCNNSAYEFLEVVPLTTKGIRVQLGFALHEKNMLV